jgi:hypothetical protein
MTQELQGAPAAATIAAVRLHIRDAEAARFLLRVLSAFYLDILKDRL